ncbi:MAG TPA: hypothetical protein VGP72_14610 [Planctomycetota bacterium]|jgi:hypothetical protein
MGKKKHVKLNDLELAGKIDRLIEIRPYANEYRDLTGDIKEELMCRKVSEFKAPSGASASVTRKMGMRWLVDKCVQVLPAPLLDLLCPRKPDTNKLNARLKALPDDKALAGCRVEQLGKPTLEVLAKGEVLASDARDDEDEADAA